MKIVKSLVILSISAVLFSCKDTASKPSSMDSASNSTAVAQKPETASFKIDGMTCAIGCAKTIETKLSKMDGVQKVSVDFDKKQATVEFDASIVTPEKIVQAVESTGDGATYKVSNVKTNGKA